MGSKNQGRKGFHMRSKMSGLVGALCLSLGLGLLGSQALAAETVRTDLGVLKGVTAGDVVSFKGVPFAAPPVGALRWRPPAPAAAWSGVRDADRYGAVCMQKPSKDNGVGQGPASEDCLTLNVFAPATAEAHGPRTKRLPVMVWIHGGGFTSGSATADLYDGSALARQGVVVVTVNYRLGRFGFFAHPALTAEASGKTDLANYGLMDQVAALKWVKRNIVAFGGDPANVTVFGESAGGMAVNRLMMMDGARGLFQKAMVESGIGHERSQTLPQAEADGAAFAAKLGVGGDDPAALRAIPADAIVAAGDIDIFKGEAPILDGKLLKENADEAFRAGHVAKIPYLAGSNSLEIPASRIGGRLKELVNFTPDQQAAAEKAYGGEETYADHVGADVVFGEPARAMARDQARSGAPVYLYRFSVLSESVSKMLKGAPHASDRQYVFQTLNASPWPTGARDAALAKTISAYWVAFAKTGDPNGPGRPEWPRYDGADRLMNFTNDGPVAMVTPDAAALDMITRARDASPARAAQ
jgi:para-nitrobenzyl esterase